MWLESIQLLKRMESVIENQRISDLLQELHHLLNSKQSNPGQEKTDMSLQYGQIMKMIRNSVGDNEYKQLVDLSYEENSALQRNQDCKVQLADIRNDIRNKLLNYLNNSNESQAIHEIELEIQVHTPHEDEIAMELLNERVSCLKQEIYKQKQEFKQLLEVQLARLETRIDISSKEDVKEIPIHSDIAIDIKTLDQKSQLLQEGTVLYKGEQSEDHIEEEKQYSEGWNDLLSRFPLDNIKSWSFKLERITIQIPHPMRPSKMIDVQYVGQTVDGIPEGQGMLQHISDYYPFYGSAIMKSGHIHRDALLIDNQGYGYYFDKMNKLGYPLSYTIRYNPCLRQSHVLTTQEKHNTAGWTLYVGQVDVHHNRHGQGKYFNDSGVIEQGQWDNYQSNFQLLH